MQFTDDDLDAAIGAGALAAEAAAAFRLFVERRRATPTADEESFRLLTGFNDIFVSIALAMVLAAIAWLAGRRSEALAGALVAAASWGLAEFFTRVRRQALPSILLLAGFVGGVLVAATESQPASADPGVLFRVATIGGAGALAALLHWLRFQVPITVAAGVLTLGAAGVAMVAAELKTDHALEGAILVAGLLAFALALAWDMSDPLRRTRRADVAFWLHLLAAPAIVHPAFSLLGLTRLSTFGLFATASLPGGPASAGLAFLLYAALGLVALIVDRRALMVSSLAYLLVAMNSLFQATGALTVSVALSALVVGAGLLLLSAFWAAARRAALRLAPQPLRRRLPPAA